MRVRDSLFLCAFACHLHFVIHFMVIVDALNFIDRSQSANQPASVSVCHATNACAKLNLQNIECFLEQIYPPAFDLSFAYSIAFALVDLFTYCASMCVVCVILYLGRVKPKVNILCFSIDKQSTNYCCCCFDCISRHIVRAY